MIGCIFFFFCLQTYENSSTRIGIMEEMGLRRGGADGYMYPFPEWQELAETAEASALEKAEVYGRGSTILAWTPAYDNYDGTEKFWRHYELSLLNED